jgi:hypothetical protein
MQALRALNVQPRWRWFSARRRSARLDRTTILSNGYWQRRFGGDPA